MTCQMVFLSGYEFTEGSQCASFQDVGTLNQTIVVSSPSIVNRQLANKLLTKFQILDNFVLSGDSSPRSAVAISSIPIAGTGAADFGQSGTCGSDLTVRSSCTANTSLRLGLTVAFTPQSNLTNQSSEFRNRLDVRYKSPRGARPPRGRHGQLS
jgi:hypothetical protein